MWKCIGYATAYRYTPSKNNVTGTNPVIFAVETPFLNKSTLFLIGF